MDMSRPRLLIVEPSPLVQNVVKMILGKSQRFLIDVAQSFTEVNQDDFDSEFYSMLLIGSDAMRNHDSESSMNIQDTKKIIISKDADLEWVKSLSMKDFSILVRPFEPKEIIEAVDYQLSGGAH
jgi:DNA-binding NtrC family response regulator